MARTDIVDLINSRVPLKKAGSTYKACCPFHQEKTPSFTVTATRQTYHCFGCGAHGNAIDFLIEHDHFNFPEAVEELAQQAGLEVPTEGEPAQSGPDTRPLYDLLAHSATLYQQQFRKHPKARVAIDYLKDRGLTGEIAAGFGLGYAPPGWDFLLASSGDTATARERLLQCGLIVEQDGKRYDRFRDRIMFPIRDRRGRVVGFGGRVVGDQKPKYLNSPETPVFHKGRELYGLYEAQQAQRKLARLLVVEGYMDVIALAQFGIRYAVATLGTATTPEHLRALLRAAPQLVFCFDGDEAGRAAAWKALESALPLATGQQEIRFLFLPDGEDPDTLVRQEGKEAFEQRLDAATPLSDFLLEQLSQRVDLQTTEGRARLASLAEPLVKDMPESLYKKMLSSRLADLVGVAPEQLGTSARRPPLPRRRPQGRNPLTPLRRAVALLLQYPSIAPRAQEVADDWRRLDKPGIGLLGEILDLIAAYPDITTAALMERWRGDEAAPHLERLSDPALLEHIPEDGLEAVLTGALERLNDEYRALETRRLFNHASPTELTEEEKEKLRHRTRRRHPSES